VRRSPAHGKRDAFGVAVSLLGTVGAEDVRPRPNFALTGQL
jgi:hypothetical protein